MSLIFITKQHQTADPQTVQTRKKFSFKEWYKTNKLEILRKKAERYKNDPNYRKLIKDSVKKNRHRAA